MKKGKLMGKIFGIALVCLMIGAMVGTLPRIAMAANKFNIGDTVEVTANLNVRTGPGTGYPEITDPDYPGYAPTGTQGKVLDGPTSANGYVWWKVDFGPGLYIGWSVEGGLQKVTPCPHSCWDRSALSGDGLAALVRNHFPLGGVTQTGESIRVTAYAIAKAESGGNPSACGDSDRSIGLWQINIDAHSDYDKCLLFEEDYNANAAKEISNNGMNWNPWCTWEKTACGGNGNEAYKQYLTEARKHFYPKVTSLSVSQTSINLGEAVTIYYSVSDDVGLDRVELWRAVDVNGDGQPDWPSDPQDTKPASGQSVSGYFEDSSHSSADTYWYGIHVVDNSGAPEAWNDERNSRTGGSPGVFGPIQVKVIVEDTVPPTVNAFSVIPSSVTLGNAFTISYTVSDTGGSGLGWIQLWRKYETASWEQVDSTTLSGVGNGPYSGSFYDTPLAVGTYWYGIHIGDDVGNWATEGGSGLSPIEVEVIQANSPPQLSNGYVNPSSGTPSTNFYYYVSYFDPDGDSPSIEQVYIDGIAYTMTWYSGLNSHITYRYGPKNLSAGGTHYYLFYFEDGKGGWDRLPSGVDMYLGPTVTGPNNPPNTPSSPSPGNHATGASINADLSWTGGDPDAGDTVIYDVYFGTSSTPPLVSDNQASTNYDPGTLGYNNKYYWKVVATDNHGASTTGLLWDFTTTSADQIVTFPDPNLEAAIREAIGKPTGDIYQSELEGLTELDASSRDISNLTGLECCINLEYLALTNNQIGDISPVSNLASLTQLHLQSNQISDISSLSNLTNLWQLGLGSNQITNLQPLSSLIHLSYLYLDNNQISDISPISNLIDLKLLGLARNQISDISPMSNFINLESLDLEGNQISDISSLAVLTKLQALWLWNNQISDISALSGLTEIKILLLDYNQIVDITSLSGLTKLGESELYHTREGVKVHLGLRANQISDVHPLVQNEGLGEDDGIDLRGNPLSENSLNVCIPQLEARGANVLYDAPKTWYVDDDLADYPDADFTRIQEAVDAASPGDTIIVGDGTYAENLDVSKSLMIRSEHGPAMTALQPADQGHRVIDITADSVVLSGFRITDRGVYGTFGSQAVLLFGVSHCTISNNEFQGTWSCWTGIKIENSSNNTLMNNAISGFYDNLQLIGSSNNLLMGNDFSSSVYAGIALWQSTGNTLTANSFVNDGIVLWDYYPNTINGNTVNGRPLVYLDGVSGGVISDAGQVILVNCNNVTVQNMALSDTSVGIHLILTMNSRIINNTVSYGHSWGIRLDASTGNEIKGNVVRGYFGIYLAASNSNTITQNSVSGYYGIGSYSSASNDVYLNSFTCVYGNGSEGNRFNSPAPLGYTYNGISHTSYLGNHWSDYAGSDGNNDGIGDTPHPIGADQDNYPLREPFENYEIAAGPWSFAIVTDLHIGRGFYDYGTPGHDDELTEGQKNCLMDRLVDVVNWINSNHEEENIKFLVILGDISDTAEKSEFLKAKEILNGLEIPYIPLIGNHDTFSFTGTEDEKIGLKDEGDSYFEEVFWGSPGENLRKLIKLFGDSWEKQPTYHRFFPPRDFYFQNYAFSYEGINFICLDYARRDFNWMALVAQPFSQTNDWLADHLQKYSEKPVIVFSHYPYINLGGVNLQEQEYFTLLVNIYNKDKVLTFGGHIHAVHNSVNYNVNETFHTDSIPVIVTKALMEPPRDFLRIVRVEGRDIEDIHYDEIETPTEVQVPDEPSPNLSIPTPPLSDLLDWLAVKVESPVELRVYDSQGRITGSVNGEVRNEIPKSCYSDGSVTILASTDSYRYEVAGTDEGSYGLGVTSVEDGEANTFTAADIPTASGAVHQYTIDWDALSEGAEGVTVEIDSDGDGEFEDTFTSDNELTRREFVVETTPPAPPMVPTMDKWGIVAMITLFAGLLVWMVRRRLLAS